MRNLIFILCCISSAVSGQISGTVEGGSGEPASFANVILQRIQDSSIVSGTATDDHGHYILPAAESGIFYLQIRSFGYKTYYSDTFRISAASRNIEMPLVTLLSEAYALDEVAITAKRDWMQTTPLGKTIHVQQSLLTTGSNALQVLERLPGVITDRRNNQFSLNGQSGVTVLFNGRKVQMSMEELMGLLESTGADNIEKIELITSPTAEYDADGGAGIINIVFKKNTHEENLVNLSCSAGYGYREKAALSAGILHRFKKVNLAVSYAFQHDVNKSGYRGEGTAGPNFLLGETSNTFYGISQRNQNNHNAGINLDYQPNSRTTTGGEFMYTLGKSNNLVNSGGSYQFKSGDYIRLDGISDGLSAKNNLLLSVYLKKTVFQKASVNFDYSFINYTNDSPAIINTAYFDKNDQPLQPQNPIFTSGNRGESYSRITVHVLKADFTSPVGEKTEVAFGVKISGAFNTNNSKVERKENQEWVVDPRSQSEINSREHLAAAYSQCKLILNAQSNLHLGLRYESWNRDINIYDNHFKLAGFFPSVLFSHTINEKSNFRLNYARRISRPNYSDLVANLFYTDPTFVFSGNPLLKPTLTNVLKVEYTRNRYNIGLSAQHELNPILRYQITSNEAMDIGISSPQNLDYQKSINLFVGCPVHVFKWWNISVTSTTSLRKYKVSYGKQPAVRTFLFQNFNMSQNLELPRNFGIELSGWYNLPFLEGTNSLEGFGVLHLGIAKKLTRNRGTFQLSLPDVFRSFTVRTQIAAVTPIVFDIRTVSVWQAESALYPVFKLSYSRSFGGNKAKVHHEDYEEKNRIGN